MIETVLHSGLGTDTSVTHVVITDSPLPHRAFCVANIIWNQDSSSAPLLSEILYSIMHVRVVIVESYEERKYKENDLFGLHTFAYRLGV